MSVPVQIWAPALAAGALTTPLAEARLILSRLERLEQRRPDQPLLLAYTDPVGLLDLQASVPYAALLAAIEPLEAGALPWRLVNLACFCPAALVAWCVEPRAPALPPERAAAFAPPAALDALLGCQWLQDEPGVLAAYLRLERHPRAAALDHRPADEACLERLRQAASPAALAAARRDQRELEAELARADGRLQELLELQRQILGLRERLVSLELEREQAERCEARRDDLELSLQLSQEELGQLSRRIALLEQLVNDGAEASRGAQGALAQLLSP